MALVRLGFSVDEIRAMTMQDFIAFTDVAYAEREQPASRTATQEDIDAFMS